MQRAFELQKTLQQTFLEGDQMTELIGIQMMATLGFVAVFAYVNARTTMKMKGKMPKSTLAKDSPHWRIGRGLPAED